MIDFSRPHAAAALVALWICIGPGGGAAAWIEASIEEGRLSLRAGAAPLAEVLHAIGEAGGFAVVLRGELGDPVDRLIEGQPLEEALRELAQDHTLIVKRDPDSGALVEVRIIASRAPAPASAAADRSMPGGDADVADAEPERPHGLSEREAFRLANLGRPAPSEDEIRFALSQGDQEERIVAIPRVGGLTSGAALGLLEDVLGEDEDPLVRSRAIAALTRLEGNNASGLLQSAALSDRDAEVRIQALNALAASGDAQRRTSALARALRDDPEPDVRRSALLALQRVGGDWARSYLERSSADLEPELRELAEQALRGWAP